MQYILLLPQLILRYSVLKWFRELQPDLKDTDTWYKSSKSAGISRFPFNSHFPILLQSHTTEEKHFLVFLLDFFAPLLLFPICILPSTSKTFSSISFPFLFLPCCGGWNPFYGFITGRPCYSFPYEKEGLTVFLIQIFTSHLAVNTL